MASQRTRIITVTGTKGKTSVVRALHAVLQGLSTDPVLAVDTHRIVLGNTAIATYNSSKETSGLVPTVCPGRFLIHLADVHNPVAVLEASVGSSRGAGLGYRRHEIGIFTNVFDDHIGMAGYLRNRRDLARAKSFIFRQIRTGGYAVYNADEPLIRKQLAVIDKTRHIQKVACTLHPDRRTTKGADIVVTRVDDDIVVRDNKAVLASVPLASIPIFQNGKHVPSLYNALSIVAAIFAYTHRDVRHFNEVITVLGTYIPDQDGSRMVEVVDRSGLRVLIDFAHESESLKHIALFARTRIDKTGRVIGVVRLSGERSDAHIKATVKHFSPYYDRLVIYDKDAHNVDLLERQNRKPGDVPTLIAKAAKLPKDSVHIALDEESALVYAKGIATARDAIVYIVGSSSGGIKRVRSIFSMKGANE